MDKKVDLAKKYKIEGAVKRIQSINEYTFYSPTMVEDGQNDEIEGPQNGVMNEPSGEMDQNGMNAQIPQQNQMPNGTDANMQQEPNEGGDMPMGNEGGVNDEELPPLDGDFEDVEMDTEQPDDEVIDVDDLTQSQETTEFKVDNVDAKLNKVLKVISKFTDAIEANDQKIEDLKKEFAKRNPTQEETMNLRSLASTPFSEKPEDYWEKQQKVHPNYNIMADNDVSTSDEQKEFEIRKGDIDNFNERDIMKSLGESHITLCDFLNF